MYQYETERPKLFTEEGQRTLIETRDKVLDLVAKSGAVRMREAIRGLSGDSWMMMAYIDRMVELGDLREVSQTCYVPGQYRVFVSGRAA